MAPSTREEGRQVRGELLGVCSLSRLHSAENQERLVATHRVRSEDKGLGLALFFVCLFFLQPTKEYSSDTSTKAEMCTRRLFVFIFVFLAATLFSE